MQTNSHKNWNSPLTPEQGELLERLATSLTPEQAQWICGYLAGIYGGHSGEAQPVAGTVSPITILYGSESGNSAALAEQTRQLAAGQGLDARLFDMADYRQRELRNERLLMIISATHGEGDPPDPAKDFYRFLHSRKAPRLEGVKFAVLALGDSSYEHFCQTGRDFDARLEELGAERLVDRADYDVDYEETAAAWIKQALDTFAEHTEPAERSNIVSLATAADRPAPVYDRNSPYPAEILEEINLNGRGSDKETRHIELSLADSGITHEPGDVLCVVPENHPRKVTELLETLQLKPSEPVSVRGNEKTLEEALRRDFEITTVTPPFIQTYAPLTDSPGLRELAGDKKRKHLLAWAAGREVVDVVREHPMRIADAGAFVSTLRPLQPREYSIASSCNANPEEVHLTVAAVRYHSAHGYREGVASTYLADRLEPGDTVPVYVRRNKNFKLTADPDRSIIMIGPGTGVAPFRAFLEEREYQGAAGENWLFFGDRRFRTDFLYQIEWQRYLKEGVLTRMDVAFSRDDAAKVYVQDRMHEHARDIYEWLENGAYFYVCGDAQHMAPDVHQALIDIVRTGGGLTDDQAQEYLGQLQRDKRYQRDVY